jgi:transcriptional regulator of arginine metabolism
MTDGGSYRYTVSAKEGEPSFSPRLKTIFRESVTTRLRAEYGRHQTLPGLASAACSAIDSMNASYILGTLAGDDTGFLVIRDIESARCLSKK